MTLDQSESIEKYRDYLKDKIEANRKFQKGIELAAFNLISYSICRAMVLNMGGAALPLVIAVSGLSNSLVNRDLWGFSINKTHEGWEVSGMEKIIRTGAMFLCIGMNVIATAGDILSFERDSKYVYNIIQEQVSEYSRLTEPKKKEEWPVYALAGVGLAATLVVMSKNQ